MALGFGHLGNGITVWDNEREEHGDYMTVAHISTDRKIKYYKGVKEDQKPEIEKYAQSANPTVSESQPYPVFNS